MLNWSRARYAVHGATLIVAAVVSFAAVLSLVGCGGGTPTQPSQIDGTYSYQITPSSTCNEHDVPYLSLGWGGAVPLTQNGSAVSMHFSGVSLGLVSLDLTGTVADGSLSFTLQARSTYSVTVRRASGTGTATIAPDQIIGTFVGDLTYVETSDLQLTCHSTDHHLVLTRTR